MTKKRKSSKHRRVAKRRPQVTVVIPRNAKLTVRRKAHNPYIITVNEDPEGRSSKKHTWYSDDYNAGQTAGY